MHLNIITPDKKIFEGEVSASSFPGSGGSFQILQNHAPLISALDQGEIKYSADKGEEIVQITGGVVEVLDNKITVLVDSVIEA